MNDPTRSHDSPWTEVSGQGPLSEVELVVTTWALDSTLSPSTVNRMGDLAMRFGRRLEATGAPSLTAADLDDCEGFVWAQTRRGRAPAVATVHLRRTTLRTLYRTLGALGAPVLDPTAALELPPKSRRDTRALSDDEILLLRTTALGRRRQPLRAAAMVALAEATATTGEVPQITWHDVDLARGVIQLPGALPVLPRPGLLSAWGIGVLSRYRGSPCSSDNPGATVMTGQPRNADRQHSAQAATTNALHKLLAAAGLADSDVRPSSVRLWAPQQALEAGERIEVVARQVGLSSLDATAALLGFEWRGDV